MLTGRHRMTRTPKSSRPAPEHSPEREDRLARVVGEARRLQLLLHVNGDTAALADTIRTTPAPQPVIAPPVLSPRLLGLLAATRAEHDGQLA